MEVEFYENIQIVLFLILISIGLPKVTWRKLYNGLPRPSLCSAMFFLNPRGKE